MGCGKVYFILTDPWMLSFNYVHDEIVDGSLGRFYLTLDRTKTVAIYVYWLTNRHLDIAILPSMGGLLLFQSLIRVQVLMCTLSKLFSISLSLFSMFSPNRVNSYFHFSGSSGHILVPGLKHFPIGTTII